MLRTCLYPSRRSAEVRWMKAGCMESSVGVYLDDVYLGRPGMANQDLIDFDQVSLLRGPQGTLFGKNTTAGVLNLTSSPPSFTPGGVLETSAGNYGYYQVRGTVSGPIA